jgi:hypothetical protein
MGTGVRILLIDMRPRLPALTALATAGALAACSLNVGGPSDPAATLRTPEEVELVLGQQYRLWHGGVYGSGNIRAMATVLAFETSSNLVNGGMGLIQGIPRPALDNAIGNQFAAINRTLFNSMSGRARTLSTVLRRLDDPAFTMGSPARDARTRAFTEFMRGLSLGYLALMYDSAVAVGPHLGAQDPGELAGYQTVMAAALTALQNSLDAAAQAGGTGGFPLPQGWIPSPGEWTAERFMQLVRSYRARFRANVARSPAERAAVGWAAVIADARQGLPEDHLITTSPTGGASNVWQSLWMQLGAWHRMSPFVIGMADVSGGYAAWIAAPLAARASDGNPFLIRTPDLRFPQGATRAEQRADFALPCVPAPCKRYYRNRTGPDVQDGPSWSWSQYDHVRFHPWAAAGTSGMGGAGPFPFLTRAELDLLEAEGHYRLGDYAAAAALINRTRVPNGLPAITAFDPVSPVPGGAECVPQVPANARPGGGGTVACGTLFEALKYEKRLETQFTHFAAWFLDMRGWGDLVEGTGVHWAPPYEELLAFRRPAASVYSTGGFGFGNPGTAGPGTYGW